MEVCVSTAASMHQSQFMQPHPNFESLDSSVLISSSSQQQQQSVSKMAVSPSSFVPTNQQVRTSCDQHESKNYNDKHNHCSTPAAARLAFPRRITRSMTKDSSGPYAAESDNMTADELETLVRSLLRENQALRSVRVVQQREMLDNHARIQAMPVGE